MAAGGSPAGSPVRLDGLPAPELALGAAIRWIDRWLCLSGERCCVSRSWTAQAESLGREETPI